MNINNKTKKIRHDKETHYNKNKIVFPATTVMTILLLASVAVVVGGLAVIPALELQQVEAGCESGLPHSERAIDASDGRCLGKNYIPG